LNDFMSEFRIMFNKYVYSHIKTNEEYLEIEMGKKNKIATSSEQTGGHAGAITFNDNGTIFKRTDPEERDN